MATPEEIRTRPEFETVDMDIDVDEAKAMIDDTIKGLTASETDAGTKYRTRDGMLVAIIGPRPTGSGDTKATLAYRTDPPMELASRKGRKLFEALHPHEIRR